MISSLVALQRYPELWPFEVHVLDVNVHVHVRKAREWCSVWEERQMAGHCKEGHFWTGQGGTEAAESLLLVAGSESPSAAGPAEGFESPHPVWTMCPATPVSFPSWLWVGGGGGCVRGMSISFDFVVSHSEGFVFIPLFKALPRLERQPRLNHHLAITLQTRRVTNKW